MHHTAVAHRPRLYVEARLAMGIRSDATTAVSPPSLRSMPPDTHGNRPLQSLRAAGHACCYCAVWIDTSGTPILVRYLGPITHGT
jgi:hypothetical protein